MRGRKRLDRHSSGGRTAIAFMGAIGLAALSALVTVLLTFLAASSERGDPADFFAMGMGITVVCVAAAALIAYVEYVPGVYRRVWNACKALVGRNDRPVETGPVVLAVDGIGAVVSTTGVAGMVVFYDWGRGEGWFSVVELVGYGHLPEMRYFVASGGVVLLGVFVLAAGWVAEGLEATGDR